MKSMHLHGNKQPTAKPSLPPLLRWQTLSHMTNHHGLHLIEVSWCSPRAPQCSGGGSSSLTRGLPSSTTAHSNMPPPPAAVRSFVLPDVTAACELFLARDSSLRGLGVWPVPPRWRAWSKLCTRARARLPLPPAVPCKTSLG